MIKYWHKTLLFQLAQGLPGELISRIRSGGRTESLVLVKVLTNHQDQVTTIKELHHPFFSSSLLARVFEVLPSTFLSC
jgi:hypothetical protein